MNDPLKNLQAELERQNEAFAEFETTLRDLGDVEIAVPQAFLDELDELTQPRNTTPAMPYFGIRG